MEKSLDKIATTLHTSSERVLFLKLCGLANIVPLINLDCNGKEFSAQLRRMENNGSLDGTEIIKNAKLL